jgi:DNA-directed RNA polymerase specialized sigma24 family protein
VDDETVLAGIYPELRRFAGAVAPPDVDPEDLLQEALARTIRRTALAALDRPDVYLRTVLVRLAANHRRGWARARARLAAIGPPSNGSFDTYPSDLDELARLPAETRAVLWLRVVEQRSYAEIAEILGATEASSRARASRGIRQLRHDLVEELREGIIQ